jgi:hypothetical protein
VELWVSSPKSSKPRQGRQKTSQSKSLSPHPGLDSICSFTHDFTVGCFLPSLRDSRKVGRVENPHILFSITLTNDATLKKWEYLDSDTSEALAEAVREYHIPSV